MKLFGDDNFSPSTLCNESRYIIMFGPDRCGLTDKVHFIFRHQNPKTGVYEEKHLKDPPSSKRGKLNHLYTLIVRPDNSFEILIDGDSIRQGSLLTDFTPSVNPAKEIDDPTDSKPADWVDSETIPDPGASKPEEWDESQPEYIKDPSKLDPPEGWLLDEPKLIADPAATKPDDWDDDIHGEWEPQQVPNPRCESAPGCGDYEVPLIRNSLYRGPWRAPTIPNPAYKGVWNARQIANPDYVEDLNPHNFRPLVGAGFEVWMVNKGIGFGNIWIGTDEEAVRQWNKEHFVPKAKVQAGADKKFVSKHATSEPGMGAGLVASLQEFGDAIVDAWLNLYTENATATIGVTAAVGLVAAVLVLWTVRTLCCRRREADEAEEEPEEKPKKKKKEPKIVEVTEEAEDEGKEKEGEGVQRRTPKEEKNEE
jgi:calnexin